MKQPIDILIKHGLVLTMNPNLDVIPDGAVAIKGNKIVDVGPTDRLRSTYEVETAIDATNKLVLPGLINTHTHAPMTILRGIADDLPLMEWLEHHIWPVERKFMDADTVYLGAMLACIELLQSGTTTFVDMYFFEDKVAEAATRAGIRCVVSEVLIDFPTPCNPTPEGAIKYTKWLMDKWRDHPLITVAVSAHAPYSCSKPVLQHAAKLASEANVPLLIHLSETKDEVKRITQQHGMSPVEYLASIGFLGPNVIAIHCVHLSQHDIELLARHRVSVSHNPESNMKLASGIAPVPQLLSAGINVGLGTDGTASNNNLDMFGEMDTAAKLHKVISGDPTVMDAKTVVKMATCMGAKVIGMDDKIGSIEKGKLADIIIVDLNRPHLTPMYDPYSHLVYSARADDVEVVIINGKLVLRDRKLLTIDIDDVLQQVRVIASRIKRATHVK